MSDPYRIPPQNDQHASEPANHSYPPQSNPPASGPEFTSQTTGPPPGHAPPGHAPPGHAPPGHAPPGHAPPGHAPPGYAPPAGSGSDRLEPRPYDVAGYPAPPDHAWPYVPNRGTNGFAIAALVFGILGGLLGIIFGIIALVQIDKNGGRGRGMAIAGIVAAALWLILIVIAVVYAISTSADRDDTGAITEEGRVSALDLRVGDCLTDLPDGSVVRDLTAVPCSQPHHGEVYSIFELPDGEYPGDEEVWAQAEDGCLDALAAVPDSSEYGLYYLHPREPTWDIDREVVCIATSPFELTSSITES